MGTLTSGLKCGNRKWFDFFVTIRNFLRFCIKNIVVDKKSACYNKLMFSYINLPQLGEESQKNKWSRTMLSVYLGKMEEAVYYPPVYFDNRYEDEWITDKQSVEIIRDVDKSDVVSAHLIEGPVLGPISPKELSGGVKTVLLILFDETGKIFNASACGDNCAKWILKIAESKDLIINLRHIMEFGDDEFEMKILNTGEVVHNMLEFVNVAGLYV